MHLTHDSRWFDLLRHNDPDPDPDPDGPPSGETADPAGTTDDTPDTGPDPADTAEEDQDDEPDPADDPTLGDKGKRALDRMKAAEKAARRQAADERKARLALETRVREFEDRDRSDLEKATAKADRALAQATKATARAVAAEVRALSTDRFADPSDAAEVLLRDPAKYVDGDGEIDVEAIETDLADLLDRKPHWAKPAPAAPASVEARKPKPKPDPAQGSRGTPPPPDFRTATKDDLTAELAKYGYRQRSS